MTGIISRSCMLISVLYSGKLQQKNTCTFNAGCPPKAASSVCGTACTGDHHLHCTCIINHLPAHYHHHIPGFKVRSDLALVGTSIDYCRLISGNIVKLQQGICNGTNVICLLSFPPSGNLHVHAGNSASLTLV